MFVLLSGTCMKAEKFLDYYGCCGGLGLQLLIVAPPVMILSQEIKCDMTHALGCSKLHSIKDISQVSEQGWALAAASLLSTGHPINLAGVSA